MKKREEEQAELKYGEVKLKSHRDTDPEFPPLHKKGFDINFGSIGQGTNKAWHSQLSTQTIITALKTTPSITTKPRPQATELNALAGKITAILDRINPSQEVSKNKSTNKSLQENMMALIKKTPEIKKNRFDLAPLYEHLKEVSQQQTHFSKLVTQASNANFPEFSDTFHLLMATLERRLNKFEEAIASYEKIINLALSSQDQYQIAYCRYKIFEKNQTKIEINSVIETLSSIKLNQNDYRLKLQILKLKADCIYGNTSIVKTDKIILINKIIHDIKQTSAEFPNHHIEINSFLERYKSNLAALDKKFEKEVPNFTQENFPALPKPNTI